MSCITWWQVFPERGFPWLVFCLVLPIIKRQGGMLDFDARVLFLMNVTSHPLLGAQSVRTAEEEGSLLTLIWTLVSPHSSCPAGSNSCPKLAVHGSAAKVVIIGSWFYELQLYTVCNASSSVCNASSSVRNVSNLKVMLQTCRQQTW